MKKKYKDILDYILIILAVIMLRTFIITPAIVKQQSMEPTLYEKDMVIVSKISKINRFDIVIFKTDKEYLIKRIIGMPGDIIKFLDNKLYVNNELIEEHYLNSKISVDDFEILEPIPENKYFVLGDNRNNSLDSRLLGFIDEKDIEGTTNLIIFPFKRFGRINKKQKDF